MSRLVIEHCAIATVDGGGHRARRRAHRHPPRLHRRGRRRPAPSPRTATSASTAAACSPRPGSSTATTTSTSGRPAGSPRRRRCSSGCRRSIRCGRTSTRRSSAPPPSAGLAALAKSGCTTASDHHYLFPRDGGDLLAVEIDAARRARPALPPVPRLDGPRALRRRAAARRGDRGPRRDPGRLRGRDRPLPRHLAGRDAADRARALLAVQRHQGADARGGRAGPLARRAPAHAHGRDRGRGAVLPRAVRLPPGRVPRSSSAGSATTCGSPTACTSTTPRCAASARRAPGVAHCPSSNAGSAPASPPSRRWCGAGAPVGLGRRRRRLQRGGRAGRRAAPGDARRAAGGPRPAGADRPRVARARARSTAPAASAARPRSARSSPARSPTSRCGGSTASTTRGSPTRWRRW